MNIDNNGKRLKSAAKPSQSYPIDTRLLKSNNNFSIVKAKTTYKKIIKLLLPGNFSSLFCSDTI